MRTVGATLLNIVEQLGWIGKHCSRPVFGRGTGANNIDCGYLVDEGLERAH